MIKRLYSLVVHDLAVAFKNRSVYLIAAIPLLIFASLVWVDSSHGPRAKSRVGIVRDLAYPAAMIASLEAAPELFQVVRVRDASEGKTHLSEKLIDGLILPGDGKKSGGSLVVVRRESIQTIAILEGVNALQKALRGADVDWIESINPMNDGGIQQQSLPTWILMIALLVGFIILPTQVAEEKEKKQTLGLFQTPLDEHEWLMSKLLVGFILILGAASLFHILNLVPSKNWLGSLIFLGLGSFYVCSAGLLMSMFCKTQASARAFGLVLYLPHLLPSALADFSQKMNVLARFIPSYQFYEPMKTFLLIGGGIAPFYGEALLLLIGGGLCYTLACGLLKRRWLLQ